MALQKDLVRVSTRPLVLAIAALSAVAMGLAGIYAVQNNSAPATSKSFAFYQDRPGPDSPYRIQHDVPDPWSSHGH